MTYDTTNIFARILRNEIPAQKHYEDEILIVIEDIAPAAPVHLLFIPKGEYVSFDDFAQKATPEAQAHFFGAIARVAQQRQLQESGYRLITNHGVDGAQSVPHFHVHLLGGKAMGALLAEG